MSHLNVREGVRTGEKPQKAPRKSRHLGIAAPGMRCLYALLWPFFHCRCGEMPELAPDQPVVYICNHYEAFGPLAAVTSLPGRFRIWMHSQVISREENLAHIQPGGHHILRFLPCRTRTWILRHISGWMVSVLRALDPIPVYRNGDPRALLKTMETTMEAFRAGERVVIFPENGEAAGGFPDGGVAPLYPGFALLGKFTRKRLGRNLLFCPVYISRKHHTCSFGTPVAYDPAGEPGQHKAIETAVYTSMQAMAAEN